MTVGHRIKEIRDKLGMSQVDFANKIGVSKQLLYKYENNIITNIPSDKIEAVGKLGAVSPAFLMGWKEKDSQLQDTAFRIKTRRSELGMTISELSERSGIDESVLAEFDKGNVANMWLCDIKDIAEPLGVSTSYLLGSESLYFGDDIQKQIDSAALRDFGKNTDTFSERKIIEKYRSLDQYSQETVSLILDREVERSKIKENVEYEVEIDNIIQLTSTEIGIAAIASAGGGTISFDKENPIKTVTVGYTPPQYDFAFEISGDSMLPAFRDREIVFIRETSSHYSGMLAVVEINHEIFLKKIYLDDGRMRLISLNKDVDAHGNRIYPDFFADERDEIHIIGKVIN